MRLVDEDSRGETILMHLICEAKNELVDAFLKDLNSNLMLEVENKDGNTALQLAITYDRKHIGHALIYAGAKVASALSFYKPASRLEVYVILEQMGQLIVGADSDPIFTPKIAQEVEQFNHTMQERAKAAGIEVAKNSTLNPNEANIVNDYLARDLNLLFLFKTTFDTQ